MTGMRAVGTTNTVRRMPSIRTSDRSSYSACSIAVLSTALVRAQADRYTDAGSVPCSAMMPSTAAAAVAGPLPRRQVVPDGQPGAPLGRADRLDAACHGADLTRVTSAS